jgi:hypothetical protein
VSNYIQRLQRAWAYHREDKSEQMDRDRVEIAAVLDTIRLVVFKKRFSENVDDHTMFAEACNLLLVLRLGQYNSSTRLFHTL